MSGKEIQAYLTEVRNMEQTLSGLIEGVQVARSKAERTTASFSPVRGSHQEYSRVEHYALDLVTLQDQIRTYSARYTDALAIVLKLIEYAKDPIQRAMLTLYYVCGKNMNSVAEDTDYNPRHAMRVMREACTRIAAATPEDIEGPVHDLLSRPKISL